MLGVGGAAGGVAGYLAADGGNTSSVSRSTGTVIATVPLQGTVEAAAATILPSVVTIQATSGSGVGVGSGVIVRSDGYVVTNNHVIAGAVSGGTITATLSDRREVAATIVGRDVSSDLAVIKLRGLSGLTVATFADSDGIKVGQSVLAVGAPLALSGTVTEGIVSTVHRPVRTGSQSGAQAGVDTQSTVLDAIQTDAAINPGNSGGPLVDLSGRVIGINSAIATVGGSQTPDGQSSASGNIGVGFAIPSNEVTNVVDQIIQSGGATHASLGVSATDPQDGTGAQLQQVTSGGAAAQAGLRAGDLVTKVGDRAVTDTDSLIAAIRSHRAGDKVTVTYRRGDSTSTVTVTLGSHS
jgi:putative serine protease PepD